MTLRRIWIPIFNIFQTINHLISLTETTYLVQSRTTPETTICFCCLWTHHIDTYWINITLSPDHTVCHYLHQIYTSTHRYIIPCGLCFQRVIWFKLSHQTGKCNVIIVITMTLMIKITTTTITQCVYLGKKLIENLYSVLAHTWHNNDNVLWVLR